MKKLNLLLAVCFGVFMCQNISAQSQNLQQKTDTNQIQSVTPTWTPSGTTAPSNANPVNITSDTQKSFNFEKRRVAIPAAQGSTNQIQIVDMSALEIHVDMQSTISNFRGQIQSQLLDGERE